MEAYQFLRHRQLIPPNVSLQETAMPNLTWGELMQLLDDYLKSKTAKAVGVDALVSGKFAEEIRNMKIISVSEYEITDIDERLEEAEIKGYNRAIDEILSKFSR